MTLVITMCCNNNVHSSILSIDGNTLNAIRHLNFADIKSVASHENVSWPTAKQSIERLLNEKLVLLNSNINSSTKTYTINPDYGFFMGISLDATMIKFVITDFKFSAIKLRTDKRFVSLIDEVKKISNLNIEDSYFAYKPLKDNLDYLEINDICSLMIETVLGFTKDEYRKLNLIAIGISLPGIVDKRTEEIIFCPNIPSLVGMPTKKILKSNIIAKIDSDDIALFFCHDTSAALVFEKEISFSGSSAKNLGDNIVYLLHEFGLGISFILDNRLISGSTGAFGELGHIQIDYVDLPRNGKHEEDDFIKYSGTNNIDLESCPCACGNKTCLEKLIKVKVFNSNNVKDFIVKTGDIVNFKGDHPYRYKVLLHFVGKAINIIVNVLNVDTIIVSNHVLGRINGFIEDLEPFMNDIALTFSSRNCKIIAGSDQPNATAIGSAMMAYYQIINSNDSKATISWD